MKVSRRDFLKTGTAAGAVTLASQIGSLGAINAYANKKKARVAGDYKALVMIFLAGGNDGNNTVIPIHDYSDAGISSYGDYAAARGADLQLARNSLVSIDVPAMAPAFAPSNGLPYGLHPSLGGADGIAELYLPSVVANKDKKLAIVTNVGTLVKPIADRQAYTSASPSHLPYQLFSHSDQIDQNQSGVAGSTSFTGWGGRMNNQLVDVNDAFGEVISIAGSQLFLMGDVSPLVVDDARTSLTNLLSLDPPPSPRQPFIQTMLGGDAMSTNKYVKSAGRITGEALAADAVLVQQSNSFDPTFPDTGIGQQLKQVAKIIKFSESLAADGTHRQVFCCVLGGFDTHAYQLNGQAALLRQLSQAMRRFYDCTTELMIGDKVTTFTMSDFGRTLDPTGSGPTVGSDHAWGNHHFVLGGVVNGGNFYGFNGSNDWPYPKLEKNGVGSTDARGRWIPSTSIDQYGANLASWFGVERPEEVFPNLGFFTAGWRLGFI